MPKSVKVYERSDLHSIIEKRGLEVGDRVMYEPDNQLGQQEFKVVQEANGKKSLRLIWDAEMGDLNYSSNSNSNSLNHYTSNNNMNLSNGGRRRAKKVRGRSRRVKKALRRTRRQARRAH